MASLSWPSQPGLAVTLAMNVTWESLMAGECKTNPPPASEIGTFVDTAMDSDKLARRMSTEPGRTCRGYMIHSAASFIEKAYEPATRKQIYDRVPPHIRELFAFVNNFDWYPAEDAASIFRAIAKHHREGDGNIVRALEAVGREIAETASTTSLRLLFRLMTPSLFAKKAPELWARNSRFGELTVTSFDGAARKMGITLRGVEGFDFIGLVAAGFVLFALEAVGCKSPRATFDFDLEHPAPSSIPYELTWD